LKTQQTYLNNNIKLFYIINNNQIMTSSLFHWIGTS